MEMKEQDSLLDRLAVEHERLRSMPMPERPERIVPPYPDLDPLVGMFAKRIRQLLGEPDWTGDAADGSAEWNYNFARVPPRWRGGGLHLEIRLDADGECIAARWRPHR